jgi:hypothetical protein
MKERKMVKPPKGEWWLKKESCGAQKERYVGITNPLLHEALRI